MEKDKPSRNGEHDSDKQSWDQALKQLYQAQASEEPDSALDKQILAQAKAQTKANAGSNAHAKKAAVLPPKVIFWRKYRWPVSSAASAILLASLLLLDRPDEEIVESLPMSSEPARLMSPQPMQASDAAAVSAQVSRQSLMQQAQEVQTDNTQVKKTISDKQALYHLKRLVESQQWQEAGKLLEKINSERPQLADKSHPQHQEWFELSEKIRASQ